MTSKAKKLIGTFYIGLPVYGHYCVETYYEKEKGWARRRKLDRFPQKFEGVLVGARYIPLGLTEYLGREEGWRFRAHRKVFVFLVRESFIGKELQVLPDDLYVDVSRTTSDVPVLKSYWPEYCKEALSREMSKWPRDEKGRWKKRSESTS